jgi:hypothetical protein
MIGAKLYTKKSRIYFFLLMYALLALAGGALVVQSIVTLVKSRRPQVEVNEDFLTLKQASTPQLVRYRHIETVTRPDKNRLSVTLYEDGVRKDVTIWLREFVRLTLISWLIFFPRCAARHDSKITFPLCLAMKTSILFCRRSFYPL